MSHPDTAALSARVDALDAALRLLRREVDAAPAAPRLPDADFQALRCRVGSDLYALPVDRVGEIVRYVSVARIADVPDIVAGAIDVRGEVVPVVDARRRFGAPLSFAARGTCIVLASLAGRRVGLVVDEVLDVVDVDRSSLSVPAGVLARALGIAAIATVGGRVVQVVDLDRVLSASDLEALDGATHPPRGEAEEGME